MIASHIDIDIIKDVMSFDVHFLMDNCLVCEIEIFDIEVNLNAFITLLTTLEKGVVSKPIFFELQDCYANKIAFKISPYPPFDWVILNIPTQNTPNQFYLDRTQFCQAIKIVIEKFKVFGI